MIQGLAATLVLIAGLVGMMTIMNRLVSARLVHPEVSRKSLHVGMGLTCLTLPWVFPDPIWFAIGFSLVLATLAAVRYVPAIAQHTTGALHAVERSSGGDIYFALSVAFLYAVARDEPVLYITPILVLTLADALAALAGIFYAKTAYETFRGRKSWEGTIVFFVIALFCIQVTILLMTDLSRVEAITVSVTLAYIATLIEGASWEGLDNLFLPVALYLLLNGFLQMNMGPGSAENVGLTSATILITLTAATWLTCRVSGICTDAGMAVVAFAYFFWAVSNFALIVPGAVVGATCLVACLAWSIVDSGNLRGRTVAAVCAPMTILVLFKVHGIQVPLVMASHAGFAAALGFVLPGLRARHGRAPSILPINLALGVLAGALLLISWIFVDLHALEEGAWSDAAIIFTVAIAAALVGGTRFAIEKDESTWLLTLLGTAGVATALAAISATPGAS